jgi:hypothetical protein
MFDLPQPAWRHIYALPTPSLDTPGGLERRTGETPGGKSPRKTTGPGQSRTALHDPAPLNDRWELSLPSETVNL